VFGHFIIAEVFAFHIGSERFIDRADRGTDAPGYF